MTAAIKQKEISNLSLPKLIAIAVACLTVLLAPAGEAEASQAISSFSVTSTSSQAGDHPDLGMSFSLEAPGQPEAAKNISVNTPEGLFGNPNAVTRCTPLDFALNECPSASQVGLITIRANVGGEPEKLLGTAPIYDLQTTADQAALFAFVVPSLNIPISIPVALRTSSDYGLRFTVAEITQLTPVASVDLTFWGFPADSSNDDQRFPSGSPGAPPGCPGAATTSCLGESVKAKIVSQPLINSPVKCTGDPLPVTIHVQTYQDPQNLTEASSTYPAVTGCYSMTFNPFLTAIPTTKAADSPSGLDLEMRAPQPTGKATTPSPISSAVVTFPEGFSINPDAADGQTMCTDEQANFDSEEAAACPDKSKIGTFAVGSDALDGPLVGSLYIGEPKPDDQYRLVLAADGFGIHAKFLGYFRPDPVTGQLVAYISNLPQVPFEDFQLHLFSSDRGLMATPGHCRLYDVVARFFPWNDKLADQTSTQSFSIDTGPGGKPCSGLVRGFQPRLEAGTSKPVAGAYSDFSLKLDRDDGDQYLGDLTFTLPPGFTGNLRGISYCPEGSIAAAAQRLGRDEQLLASCPATSQIGTTNVAAGPGSHPFHAVGKMYLSGLFKGAPLSLVAITPALAGPYDYGTVVVRVALHIDAETAQVFAASDTVPSIIGGIPIRMRSIRVNIDRPNFTINPTNCSNFTVKSQGIGDQGTVVDFFSPFTAVNCATLPFKPKMTVRQVGSRKKTRRAKNPELQIDLRTRTGDANIKSISVTLPNAFEIDQRHLGNICSEKQLIENECAGRTAIGRAITTTPLLDAPLQGPVYAVSGSGGLPRLAFVLNGQVSLLPRADTRTAKGGRLKTTVPVVPDAEIGHFRLNVFGGKTGYLINTRDLCERRTVIRVAYKAQNGLSRSEGVRLRARCGKSRREGHRR